MSSEGVPDFNPQVNLGIYHIYEDSITPSFATEGSACFDIFTRFDINSKIKAFTAHNYEIEMKPKHTNDGNLYISVNQGLRVMVPTGIIFDIPKGYSVRLHNRSGLSLKNGVKLVNQEAVIDSDYVNETFILIETVSNTPFELPNHTRICQGELVSNLSVNFYERQTKPTSETRTGGFGSTGVS